MGLAGCGGGSSDSVLTGQTTNPAGETAGCYDLDWEFKPGSTSRTTLRYESEPISGQKESGTLVSTFVATGIKASGLFPGNEAFETTTTVVKNDLRMDSYMQMRRIGPGAYELGELREISRVRTDGIGPSPRFTVTTFTPALAVITPTLAVGQQEVQHRKGIKTVSQGGFGPITDVNTTETIKLISIETISVEAGRYETCRFEHTSSSTPGLSTTQWVIRGRGVTVKKTTTEVGKMIRTEEATAVEIDGKPV